MSKTKKIDPTGYQVMVDGKEKLVTDCTKEELIQSLCESIEAIELLDQMRSDLDAVFDAWRRGKPMPSIPGYQGNDNG